MVNTNLRFQTFSLLFLLTLLRMPPLSVHFISMLTNISFITNLSYFVYHSELKFLLFIACGSSRSLFSPDGLSWPQNNLRNCDFDVIFITCHILICAWVFLWILVFFYLLIFLCSPLCEYIVF